MRHDVSICDHWCGYGIWRSSDFPADPGIYSGTDPGEQHVKSIPEHRYRSNLLYQTDFLRIYDHRNLLCILSNPENHICKGKEKLIREEETRYVISL